MKRCSGTLQQTLWKVCHGAEIQTTSHHSQHVQGSWRARPTSQGCALYGWGSWLFNNKSIVHREKLNYCIGCALGFSAEAAAASLSWMLRGQYLK